MGWNEASHPLIPWINEWKRWVMAGATPTNQTNQWSQWTQPIKEMFFLWLEELVERNWKLEEREGQEQTKWSGPPKGIGGRKLMKWSVLNGINLMEQQPASGHQPKNNSTKNKSNKFNFFFLFVLLWRAELKKYYNSKLII